MVLNREPLEKLNPRIEEEFKVWREAAQGTTNGDLAINI
jgi:hypothetical protein